MQAEKKAELPKGMSSTELIYELNKKTERLPFEKTVSKLLASYSSQVMTKKKVFNIYPKK